MTSSPFDSHLPINSVTHVLSPAYEGRQQQSYRPVSDQWTGDTPVTSPVTPRSHPRPRYSASISDSRVVDSGGHSGRYRVMEPLNQGQSQGRLDSSIDAAGYARSRNPSRVYQPQQQQDAARHREKSPAAVRPYIPLVDQSHVTSTPSSDRLTPGAGDHALSAKVMHSPGRQFSPESAPLRDRHTSSFYASQWSLQQALSQSQPLDLGQRPSDDLPRPRTFGRMTSVVRRDTSNRTSGHLHGPAMEDRTVPVRTSSEYVVSHSTANGYANDDMKHIEDHATEAAAAASAASAAAAAADGSSSLLGSIMNLMVLSVLALLLTVLALLLLLKATSRSAVNQVEEAGLVQSNSTHVILITTSITISTAVIAVDISCLIIFTTQAFFALKLTTCSHGYVRASKYLSDTAGIRLTGLCGFLLSVPLLLIDVLLLVLGDLKTAAAIVVIVLLAAGVISCVVAVAHNTALFLANKTSPHPPTPPHTSHDNQLSTLV